MGRQRPRRARRGDGEQEKIAWGLGGCGGRGGRDGGENEPGLKEGRAKTKNQGGKRQKTGPTRPWVQPLSITKWAECLGGVGVSPRAALHWSLSPAEQYTYRGVTAESDKMDH